MNEQAILDSYNLFKQSGYTKSLDEYKKLLNSNPSALNDSYSLFKQSGYNKGVDDYKELMGLKKKVSTQHLPQNSSNGETIQKPKAPQNTSASYLGGTSSDSSDTNDIPDAIKPNKTNFLGKADSNPVAKQLPKFTTMDAIPAQQAQPNTQQSGGIDINSIPTAQITPQADATNVAMPNADIKSGLPINDPTKDNRGVNDPYAYAMKASLENNPLGGVMSDVGVPILNKLGTATDWLLKSYANVLKSSENVKKQAPETQEQVSNGSDAKSVFERALHTLNSVVASSTDAVGSPIATATAVHSKIINSALPLSEKNALIDKINVASTNLEGGLNHLSQFQKLNNTNSTTEHIIQSLSGMLPEIGAAALTDGASLEAGAGGVAENSIISKNGMSLLEKYVPKAVPLLEKYAPKVASFVKTGATNGFAKVLGTEGALESMANTKDDENVYVNGLKGYMKGSLEALYMHGLGELGGELSKPVAKKLVEAGASSAIANQIANPLANAGVFASAKILRTGITEGRIATPDELAQEVGIAVAFSLPHIGMIGKNHNEIDYYADNLLKDDALPAFSRVINETKDNLVKAYNPNLSEKDIDDLKESRDAIKTEILKQSDLSVKQELLTQAINIQNTIDANTQIPEIIKNKGAIIKMINNGTMVEDDKDFYTKKIEALSTHFDTSEEAVRAKELAAKIEEKQAAYDKAIASANGVLTPETEKTREELKQAQQNDKENGTGVQSNIGEGKEPIKAKPNETTGGEKVETGGNVQASEEEVVKPIAEQKAEAGSGGGGGEVDWSKDIENVDLSKVDWKNPTTEESIAGHESHIQNNVKKGQQSLLPKIRELAKKYNLTKEQYLKVLPSIRQVLSNAEPNINSIENIISREWKAEQALKEISKEGSEQPTEQFKAGDKVNYNGAEHTIASVHETPEGKRGYSLKDESGEVVKGETDKIKYVNESSLSKVEPENIAPEEPKVEGVNEGVKPTEETTTNEKPKEDSSSDGIGISRKARKEQYGFTKKFEQKSDQKIADDVQDQLQDNADKSGRTIEQQAEYEVDNLNLNKGEANAHDIITTAYHLNNLDAQIKNANEKGEDTSILLAKRESVLDKLTQLGSNAGKSLGLFSRVYKVAENGRLEVIKATIKRELGIDNIPKSIVELEHSNRTDDEKKILRPYVEEIVKTQQELSKIIHESETSQKEAVENALKEYIEEYKKSKKPKTPKDEGATLTIETAKEVSSKLKDIADKLDEKDKSKDATFFSKVSDAIREFAEKINKGENIKKIVDDVTDGFTDNEKSELNDYLIEAGVPKEALGVEEIKESPIEKIKSLAEIDNTGNITQDMVGSIKNIFKQFVDENVPYDKLIKETTNAIKDHLPNATESDVLDAILDRGEFKKEQKSELKSKLQIAKEDVKRLSGTESKIRALQEGKEIQSIQNDNTLTPKQKKDAIEARKLEYEKKLDELLAKKQAEKEQAKKDKIAHDKKTKEEYKKLETEQNRQLKKLNDLKAEKERLLNRQEKEVKAKRDAIKDTPEIEQAKKEIKEVEQQIREEKEAIKKTDRERNSKIKKDNKLIETERNRQLEKVAKLTEKRDNLLNGIREIKEKLVPKVDTPEIEALNKQVEIADKTLRETENAKRKIERDAENKAKKLAEIQAEIDHAITEKTMFKKALKSPKTIDEDLRQAKETLKNEYNKVGVKREYGDKTEIRIAQDAENAIKSIQDSDLPDDVKKEHIKAINDQANAQLKNTKQGVLRNFKNALENYIFDLREKAKSLLDEKKPTDEIIKLTQKLDSLSKTLDSDESDLQNKIDKSDQTFQEIINKYENTDFKKDLIKIQEEYHKDWQRTSNELQSKEIIEKARRSVKEAERRIAAEQYTEIPTTKLDAKLDAILAKEESEKTKAWSKLGSMAQHAREQRQNRGIVSKWMDIRRSIMTASVTAIEKVGASGIIKPLSDTLFKQSFGRLSAKLTGIRPTEIGRLGSTFKQFKNQESANKFMQKVNDAHIKAIDEYINAKGTANEEKALKKLNEASFDYNASLPYLFINAGSHIDIKQIMINGATDFDAKMGKYKQSFPEQRKAMQEVGFWLESINRTHAAIKSVSHRQALMNEYFENLQYFQDKNGAITPESQKMAWDAAVLRAEEGRFGEKTYLSYKIASWKNSDNKLVSNAAKYAFPVAKIGINITKQGLDMALPFDLAYKTHQIAKKGIAENRLEGKEYSNAVVRYREGLKRAFDELPLEQKKQINTLLMRGLTGLAQYAIVGYLISNGLIKYGGVYDENDKFGKHRQLGSDGEPLDYGQLEINGWKTPKLVSMVINHTPYFLPASLATIAVQESEKSGKGTKVIAKVVNEVYERLPISSSLDLVKGLMGDEYKLQNVIANEVPTMKNVAEYLDKDDNGEPIKRDVKGDGFWQTTGNIIISNTPVRKTLPEME